MRGPWRAPDINHIVRKQLTFPHTGLLASARGIGKTKIVLDTIVQFYLRAEEKWDQRKRNGAPKERRFPFRPNVVSCPASMIGTTYDECVGEAFPKELTPHIFYGKIEDQGARHANQAVVITARSLQTWAFRNAMGWDEDPSISGSAIFRIHSCGGKDRDEAGPCGFLACVAVETYDLHRRGPLQLPAQIFQTQTLTDMRWHGILPISLFWNQSFACDFY
ncbi:hypothetical protein F4779DRAFT_561282 [Xylariaceae sp. FL0662B]|nr:hypothetical protein F4779DRAFT_561282 [Xylariaceae sp. FL0662B]